MDVGGEAVVSVGQTGGQTARVVTNVVVVAAARDQASPRLGPGEFVSGQLGGTGDGRACAGKGC